MFKRKKEIKLLEKEIETQDAQYYLLLKKYGNLERKNKKLDDEVENLTKAKNKYLKRIREMRKELKELKNEK